MFCWFLLFLLFLKLALFSSTINLFKLCLIGRTKYYLIVIVINYIKCIKTRIISFKSIELLISIFYIMIHLGSEEIIKDKLNTSMGRE